MAESGANVTTNFTTISPEERIKELNAIDDDIPKLLACAAKAIGLLPNERYDEPNPRLEDVQEVFQKASSEYFALLSSIEVRLKRQAYALEEAGLIGPGTKQDANNARSTTEDQTTKRAGGGPLDSSWLNARAKDSIGQDLKQEVLNEAKDFLTKNNIDVAGAAGDSMDVDTEANMSNTGKVQGK